MAVSPVRLNHAVLFVADLDRAVRFYTEVFGMELITREPGLNGAFLRLPHSGNAARALMNNTDLPPRKVAEKHEDRLRTCIFTNDKVNYEEL